MHVEGSFGFIPIHFEKYRKKYMLHAHQYEACEWSQRGALTPLGFLEQVLHTAETGL